MGQRREIAELHVGIARDAVCFPDGGKHLRLLDGIDTQVGFEVEIGIEHFFRIPGLFGHNRQDFLADRIFHR